MNQLPKQNIRLIAADVLCVRAKAVCDAIGYDDWSAWSPRLQGELREAVALYEAAKPISTEPETTTEGTDNAAE